MDKHPGKEQEPDQDLDADREDASRRLLSEAEAARTRSTLVPAKIPGCCR